MHSNAAYLIINEQRFFMQFWIEKRKLTVFIEYYMIEKLTSGGRLTQPSRFSRPDVMDER